MEVSCVKTHKFFKKHFSCNHSAVGENLHEAMMTLALNLSIHQTDLSSSNMPGGKNPLGNCSMLLLRQL